MTSPRNEFVPATYKALEKLLEVINMTNEFLTDAQLDTVYGANQIPMIKEPPANKIPPRPKTNTARELKSR